MTADQITKEDEILFYLGQMMDANLRRVVAQACQNYASTTCGRDRSIAEDVATLMAND